MAFVRLTTARMIKYANTRETAGEREAREEREKGNNERGTLGEITDMTTARGVGVDGKRNENREK